MKTLARTLVGFSLCAFLSVLTACGGDESTATTAPSSEQPANPLASTETPTPPSPGGAPSFGSPSGMGLSTGDAAHSSGMGTGLMGFHGTGAAGTSGAISDRSPVNRVVPETTEEKP
jgi:hypothetical protein